MELEQRNQNAERGAETAAAGAGVPERSAGSNRHEQRLPSGRLENRWKRDQAKASNERAANGRQARSREPGIERGVGNQGKLKFNICHGPAGAGTIVITA